MKGATANGELEKSSSHPDEGSRPTEYILCNACYQKEQYPKEDAVEAA